MTVSSTACGRPFSLGCALTRMPRRAPGYTAVGAATCQQDGSFSVSSGGGGGSGGHRRHMQDDAGARCEPNECTTGLTIPNSNRNDDARCSVSPTPVPPEKDRFEAVKTAPRFQPRTVLSKRRETERLLRPQGVIGDVCEFTCSEGFTASGSHSCQPDGSFAGGACSGVDCGASIAGLDPHASASCGGDTTAGVSATACRRSFSTGDERWACQGGEVWERLGEVVVDQRPLPSTTGRRQVSE